jgi:GT2 family glycosyltransferase
MAFMSSDPTKQIKVRSSSSKLDDPGGGTSERDEFLSCINESAFWKPLHVVHSTWLEHAPFAFWLIDAIRPKALVALGTYNGFSYMAFCQAVRRLELSTACFAVEPWSVDEDASDEGFARLSQVNQAHYAAFSTLLRCSYDEALSYVGDGAIDLLQMDGRGTYDAVRTDFGSWRTKLSGRAIVLFHDLNGGERESGIRRLWLELAGQYPSFEFMHGYGLGVVAIGQDVPAALGRLFQASASERDGIRIAYARLGEAVSQQHDFGQAQQYPDEISSALDRIRAELETSRAENTRLLAEQRAGKAENHRLRAELSMAARAAQLAQQRALQIEQSTIWRASAPLRKILGSAPGPQRQLLHRSTGAVRRMAAGLLRISGLRRSSPDGKTAVLPKDIPKEGGAAAVSRHLAFRPFGKLGSSASTADRNGRYTLVRKPAGYVYVPPQRPENLEDILQRLSWRPLFSIVVPVYNTPPDLLARMLASVRGQWYPDWELILADDASRKIETQKFLTEISDPRMKLLSCASNGGISAATNRAIAEAKGDYVVFLDHDDELTEDCLYELAICIARDAPDFIYSDEDKIDAKGRFTEPFFKPDWSPDALMSTMYTCHVSCLRRSLLQGVGLLRSAYDGAQDWDLVLRVTEQARRIVHIPKVLYHWRIIPASAASGLAAKPYAIEAGRLAREAALQRRGLDGVMEAVVEVPGYFRVRYAPCGAPLVSIVIPTRDNGEVLRRCLDSLWQISSWQRFEVIIIDNGSVDPDAIEVLQDLAARDRVRVIRHDAPFNWSKVNNLGARAANGELLLFLNDDTQLLAADCLERMAGYAQLAHVGAVGAKLLYPETRQVQHAGVVNLANGPNHPFWRQPADAPGYFMRNLLEFNWVAVTGACLMIERSKFIAAGGFDETFPVGYNDIELCFRLLQRGLFNVVCPTAVWLHHESLTRGSDMQDPQKFARLMADKQHLYLRHPSMLLHDPFYSPNLSPDGLQFEVPV